MQTNKSHIVKGLKYLGGTLPLLVLGPVLLTIGFRAQQDGIYIWLIFGVLIMIIAIITAFIGVKSILKGLFNTEK